MQYMRPAVSSIEALEMRAKLERNLREEISTDLARLAMAIEKSGVDLDIAIMITKGIKAGFTQKQVARALEIDPETVSKIESVCKRTGFWNCFGLMQNAQTA